MDTRHREWILLLLFIGITLSVRLLYLSAGLSQEGYGDAAYYISAGEKYISGTLPNAVNPEHPPLAKFIIGFFAVALGRASLSSLIFGLAEAILVYAIVRELLEDPKWALVAVWLVAFDPISIGTSVFPVLEVFMVTFALGGLLLVLRSDSPLYSVGAGILFGFAMASKWTALLFFGPTLFWLLLAKKYKASVLVFVSAIPAYLLPYASLIAGQGIQSFVKLQVYDYNFLVPRGSGELGSLALTARNIFDAILFHATTFVQMGGINHHFYPESFSLFGYPYVSIAEGVSPWIMLAFFPVLFLLYKRWRTKHDRRVMLFVLILIANFVAEGLLHYSSEFWLYAPMSISLCIAIPIILERVQRAKEKFGFRTTIYLAQVPIWLIFASAILMLRFILLR